jgi:hypothetical protein
MCGFVPAVERLPYHLGRRRPKKKCRTVKAFRSQDEQGNLALEQSRALMEMTHEIEATEEHSAADN